MIDIPEVPPVVEPEITYVPSITLSGQAVRESNLPEALQNVKVDFSFEEDTVKATYSDLPEEYSAKARLYFGTGLAGLMKGRLELVEGDDYVGYKFGTGYATKADYKFEFRAMKNDDKAYTTISSQSFNVQEVASEKVD